MKTMYGYIRVSTSKQGDGTSLEEQKLAIVGYANDHNFKIVEWFEEISSASKGQRITFNRMMRQLKRKSVDGVIIHKIDRGSRNMKDWSDISQLSDKGVEIHFAHDNVDLQSRSSRLLADMQAVIAIDYARNLSEETRKGLDGRLRQGIYPFHAPIGYLNTGRGTLKAVDLEKAPLIVKMFELYATGDYSQDRLRHKMNELGLTNTRGNPLCKNNVFRTLHNPFYMGVIKILKTGKTYQGKHAPLITSVLYEAVQARLKHKAHPKPRRHMPVYRGIVICELCKYTMTGEKHRGRYYYRCHQKECETKTIREDVITKSIDCAFKSFVMPDGLREWFFEAIDSRTKNLKVDYSNQIKASKLLQGKLKVKLDKSTDLLLDGVFTKDAYTKKQEQLNMELRSECEKVEQFNEDTALLGKYMKEICEQLFCPKVRSFEQFGDEKRDYAKMLTSNISVQGRKPLIELKTPYKALQNIQSGLFCCHLGSTTRIMTGENTICVHKDCQKELFKKIHEELIKIYYEDGEAM